MSPNLYPAHGLEPRDALLHMLYGPQVRQLLLVAAQLCLADLLADAPRSASELAARTGTNAAALHRVLRALSVIEGLPV